MKSFIGQRHIEIDHNDDKFEARAT